MAEAIMAQITMAGGAINLSFSTILYSHFSSNPNNEYDTLSYNTINSYDWKCAVIYHPLAINPFICFNTQSIFTNGKMISISGLTPSGTNVQYTSIWDNNTFRFYGGCTLCLFT